MTKNESITYPIQQYAKCIWIAKVLTCLVDVSFYNTQEEINFESHIYSISRCFSWKWMENNYSGSCHTTMFEIKNASLSGFVSEKCRFTSTVRKRCLYAQNAENHVR